MEGADNSKLITLLDDWGKDPSGKNFERVMEELVYGNTFLMLPSINKDSSQRSWIASGKEDLQLTCIFEVKGIKVLGAFTSEDSIIQWSKGRSQAYTSMKTKDVMKLCEMNDIYKIVINSGSPDIFLAERSRSHIN